MKNLIKKNIILSIIFLCIRAEYDVNIRYSPNNKFAAVLNVNQNNFSFYKIQPNKELILMQGSPYATGYKPVSLAFSPNEQILAIANYDSSNLTIYQIDQKTQTLKELIGSPFNLNFQPTSVQFSLDNNYLAIGDPILNIYFIYSLNLIQNTFTFVKNAKMQHNPFA